MTDANASPVSFSDLNLPATLTKALSEVGYETPTPIQAETIPYLLQGLDLLGHAPTGTGKTAAFALPLLARLNGQKPVQVMVLTPTRELAIQVAEAFQRYAAHIEDFHVLPIYGGQEYTGQIRALRRGVHVVVGTPGRIMDHMRKGTLGLEGLQTLVLDEADEMLRMGFIDDVEWILERVPAERQMALFSATMPKEVKRISKRYLRDPREIKIKSKTATAETIRQRYWLVSNLHKLDALTRILEVEPFDAMLMFVRTKIATVELAEKLVARGYAAAALNGDMPQKNREQMVDRLKRGALDILVATDVAARGLDVNRISHVVNYDIPYDTEAYIHRIGRTGRAGREGDAILFVAPREQRMLKSIEKATRQPIEPLELPSKEMVNNKRIENFKQTITDTLASGELEFMQKVLAQYEHDHDTPAIDIAAALAKMALGDKPLLLDEREAPRKAPRRDESRPDKHKQDKHNKHKRKKHKGQTPEGMERFRIEVGHMHEVKPGNIVGAIANEAGVGAENIGHIDISDAFSLVDLPSGMPGDVFHDLKKVWVCGQQLKISRLSDAGGSHADADSRSGKNPRKKKRSDKKRSDKRAKRANNSKARSADSPSVPKTQSADSLSLSRTQSANSPSVPKPQSAGAPAAN
jgi:ATP-dependent RNA helicase DeaD